MSTIQTQITAINAAFDQAFNTKNAVAIGQLYADNAVVMPAPAGEPVLGSAAIQTFFAGLIAAGVIDHQLTLVEAVEDGNLAYQRGNWAGAMMNEKGEKQTFGGNVHLVYRKQADGNWKAVTHIWN
ncbi:MAG: nuclear transport factor 2 family protein [Methylotenera sp.]|nr:nuclear transport factor 2 family protein [Methylotenera sp.]MDO9233849.1 nuclear transport factor 2 family protein [Methylotenera sp.]MDO9389454.1 nuclear transport factor 2 family protein [Methylotenera sp.]MDP1595625.1 nuclear transport factor 2 family protein [Methylotenera sp.]MDP1753969.1 nuclear transport factor 2 family protein [Methylotenera sp.]